MPTRAEGLVGERTPAGRRPAICLHASVLAAVTQCVGRMEVVGGG
jgi:hypothetical protein